MDRTTEPNKEVESFILHRGEYRYASQPRYMGVSFGEQLRHIDEELTKFEGQSMRNFNSPFRVPIVVTWRWSGSQNPKNGIQKSKIIKHSYKYKAQ